MFPNRRARLFRVTLWSLLSLWLCFGCLEVAEQFQVCPEAAAEDQDGQDLDAAVLSQLASGLKPDVPSLAAPRGPGIAEAITEPIWVLSLNAGRQRRPLMLHDPPSRPLHQQLCVYRM